MATRYRDDLSGKRALKAESPLTPDHAKPPNPGLTLGHTLPALPILCESSLKPPNLGSSPSRIITVTQALGAVH